MLMKKKQACAYNGETRALAFHHRYLSSIGTPPPLSPAAIPYAAKYAAPNGTATVSATNHAEHHFVHASRAARNICRRLFRSRSAASSGTTPNGFDFELCVFAFLPTPTPSYRDPCRTSSQYPSSGPAFVCDADPYLSLAARRLVSPSGAKPSSRASRSRPRAKSDRLDASLTTAYARFTRRNDSAAFGDGLTSGCKAFVRLRYASLISSMDASDETPSTSYGSDVRAAFVHATRRERQADARLTRSAGKAPRKPRRSDTELGAPADTTHGRSGRSMARAPRDEVCQLA